MVWKTGTRDPYALLAALLRETKGVDSLPEIARTAAGKPYFPGCPELHFSLSHSGPLALCALADTPIGADLELVRPRKPGLPRYVLSDREHTWYGDRGSRWEDFYTLWTLKEARVKCTGEGLFRRPARAISVPLLEPGETAPWEGFTFTALAGEGWRGALCRKNCEQT